MSAQPFDRDRRGAQRLALPKPVPATLGGFPGTLVEFSLTGCRFDHADRVALKSKLALRFNWRGSGISINAVVVRSEMTGLGKKASYTTGLEFCQSADDAPHIAREIVNWLLNAAAKKSPATIAAPPPPPALPQNLAPPIDEDAEIISAPYLQCTFSNGGWLKLYVDEPQQPRNGFTILAPSNESEADVLCRAYEIAGPDGRKTMRTSFEKAIARSRH